MVGADEGSRCQPGGFHLTGLVDGQTVAATLEGRTLSCDEELRQRALTVLAVDEVLLDHGSRALMAAVDLPVAILVALYRACDDASASVHWSD
jgi:hypothetical protein